MKRKWWIVSAFLIYALIFGEFFVRVMEPQALVPRYVTAGADGIRANVPNAVYYHKTPEVNVEMRINSQGIRSDREFSPEKPADVYRIVLLGDSFFMGYEVDLEDSIAWHLEKNMLSQGVNAEVVNLSVSGFGTAENLIALRERGLVFQPDLIIMQWHDTDPGDNVRTNLFSVEGGDIRVKSTSYLPGVATRNRLMRIPGYEWLINNSHLYSVAREKLASRVKKLLQQRREFSAKAITETSSVSSERDVDNLDELLILEVKKEAEYHGAKFLLFDVPRRISRSEFNSSFSKLDLTLLEDTVMVSPAALLTTKGGPDVKLYTERGHGHWTVLGNRVVADYLTEQVFEKIYRVADVTN